MSSTGAGSFNNQNQKVTKYSNSLAISQNNLATSSALLSFSPKKVNFFFIDF